MATPKLQKAWTITPNIRRVYTTLADQVGYYAYKHKVALLAAGWSMWWSCDGTTGPSDASDHTDRITDETKFATRVNALNSPLSWFVMQNVEGLQVLFAFHGASDDQGRIAYSHGGNYALAATKTWLPTNTVDDVVLACSGTTLVNSTTSGDRVFHIWATSESFSSAHYRSTTLQQYIGVEKFDSAVSTVIQAKPYIGFNLSDVTRNMNTGTAIGGAYSTFPGDVNWRGVATYHRWAGNYTISKSASGHTCQPNTAGSNPGTTVNAVRNQMTLQNRTAMPLLPLFWFASNDDGREGFMGSPIDWWWAWSSSTTTPGAGDMFPALDDVDASSDPERTNWLVALGASVVRPWRDAAVSYQTA